MRLLRIGVTALMLSTCPAWAGAQSTTGTIRGQVVDAQGLAMPGVMVSVTSPNLQGTRSAVTSEHGDYILTLLPSGLYTATFEIAGFEQVQRVLSLAPTQEIPLSVALGPAAIAASVEVIGHTVNVLTNTAQVATSFSQQLIASLPVSRDLSSPLLLATSVHQTGAGGAFSISGSFSFENQFMVNGVSVVDNIRGQPYDLYVEDAIEETSVATAGISAEFGRFTGGVVNIVTKSGGNAFSGSFRDTLQNDKWRAHTPFERTSIAADPLHLDTPVDATVPTYEYTFGGPGLRDKLWFFTSGRKQTQEAARTLVVTGVPYVFSENATRFEVKGTYSINAQHRIQGVLIKNDAKQTNATQNTATSMDLNSLYNFSRLMDLLTVNYSAIVNPRFFLEARYSTRNETLKDVGSRFTDPIAGTLLVDRSNRRYWSPTFCGVCAPEERDGADLFLKGSYFLSTRRLGSHEMVVGYDGYDDNRFANNHQSGSDYQILGTNAIVRGTGASAVIYPQFIPDGNTFIVWRPIVVDSEGSHFRTHSLFYNDAWRASDRITANVGLRYDRNHGANSAGSLVTSQSAWSPRVGVVIDPTGQQKWTVMAGIARYVAGIANTIADASSPGGNADAYGFAYAGPAINGDPAGSLLPTPDALALLFKWFEANGQASLPLALPATVRGVTPQIGQSLKSPGAWEYSAGASRQVGQRASIRVDVTYRNHHDFYAQRTDLTTGRVTDSRTGVPPAVRGRLYDLTLIENTDLLKRRYVGMTAQGAYRINAGFNVGGSYTLSRLWGNVDGETAGAGPTANDVLQFPEYKVATWNYPDGDLAADQRHRARAWLTYGVANVPGLSLGLIQLAESGVPYGAVGTINAQSYVANPGYVTAPTSTNITYYYTARDAFRTEGQRRTDLAINYAHRLWAERRAELFGQVQVLNIFNQYQLCGCGASTVFQNGGAIIAARIDQVIRTPVTSAAFQGFNPFTTTPRQGVNWDLGPSFGAATSRLAFTTPRTIRISFGIRF